MDITQALLTRLDEDHAVKTWRYLRLAMITVVFGLAVSIAVERMKTDPGCFQTSISAYYYTPVHGFFVGALMTIGACLICLKGNTEWEDTLLNLAGMFAPVVALVPTVDPGSCGSVLATTEDRNVNIENNMWALLAVGAAGLVTLLVLAIADKRRARLPEKIGAGFAAAMWLIAAYFFLFQKPFFRDKAHYTAATLMFVCIWLVVLINGLAYKMEEPRTRSWLNRYMVIAGLMAVDALVIVLARSGWDHWILVMEATQILLFATFWAVQTKELWTTGLRGACVPFR